MGSRTMRRKILPGDLVRSNMGSSPIYHHDVNNPAVIGWLREQDAALVLCVAKKACDDGVRYVLVLSNRGFFGIVFAHNVELVNGTQELVR